MWACLKPQLWGLRTAVLDLLQEIKLLSIVNNKDGSKLEIEAKGNKLPRIQRRHKSNMRDKITPFQIEQGDSRCLDKYVLNFNFNTLDCLTL